MPLFSYIFLFLSVIASGLTFFLFRKINEQYLKLCLAFSGAYLFAISVIHLIPEVYSSHDNTIGIYVLVGFLFQIILEFFSEGIEHGHIHVHQHEDGLAFPTSIIISLCIHSFLEGMPLVAKDAHTVNTALYTGILLHHIPVAFALMAMLMGAESKKSVAVFLLIFFAAMAPAGALSSNILSTNIITNISVYFDKIMAVVIGIFLHISTTILFESSKDHRFNLYKMLIILLGAGLALLTM